ncbi:hypothetical protein H6F90_12070 [Trichocoleus sp. FACHB-591]|uniref:hypothetical protein n=1 Tax=Trichocoleus sp. FACHB-591 TaxID=2692872 RepID=UPI00168980D1|nr:hypothetical protein [Trichocoleus sp. FACHB-591]MBD2095883.1 hypothetical protein [Trichocoleus sp. FACHB-591]
MLPGSRKQTTVSVTFSLHQENNSTSQDKIKPLLPLGVERIAEPVQEQFCPWEAQRIDRSLPCDRT